MKKIIALALALIMALSMASVAFAAITVNGVTNNEGYAAYTAGNIYAPGTKITATLPEAATKIVATNFTKSDAGDYNGASYIESVKLLKSDKKVIVITLKESYTLAEEKLVKGDITVKIGTDNVTIDPISFKICNNVPAELTGEKKVKNLDLAAETGTVAVAKDTVQIMDEDGGYVFFKYADLTGIVKMNKEEKVYLNITGLSEDDQDAFDALVGEDYLDEATIEYYQFETAAFKSDVDFRYYAYEEDDHFFYVFDGEKLTKIDAEYNDDEEVDAYVFTAAAKGAIIVTDTEIVLAAEDTKNPDTGANDVVGVAAALAVVSLVAAGAVSLKK